MFPSEEELQVDELSHAELRAYVEGSAHTPPSIRPQFNIKLKVENPAVSITLLCTYPTDYPKVLPDIAVRVKVLTWKRIMIRHREDVPFDNTWTEERTDSLRKFTGFHEASFDTHGTRGKSMDLGQLYQFLSDKGCSNIFQIYFGIEGR